MAELEEGDISAQLTDYKELKRICLKIKQDRNPSVIIWIGTCTTEIIKMDLEGMAPRLEVDYRYSSGSCSSKWVRLCFYTGRRYGISSYGSPVVLPVLQGKNGISLREHREQDRDLLETSSKKGSLSSPTVSSVDEKQVSLSSNKGSHPPLVLFGSLPSTVTNQLTMELQKQGITVSGWLPSQRIYRVTSAWRGCLCLWRTPLF